MNSQILSLRGHAGEEQQLLRIFNLNEVAVFQAAPWP